ncbi:MAG: glycosyltransferase family 4 protein [Candidatus Aminicenantes bacterium]|nr:glycosyltransferase family 4 protein [Candidatus Aminicenantes bacterium]
MSSPEAKKNEKRIIFPTFAHFPSSAAHGVSIMKMCESLSEAGLDVTLIGDLRKKPGEIFDDYGIKTSFSMAGIRSSGLRVLGRLEVWRRTSRMIKKGTFDGIYVRDFFNGYTASRLQHPYIFELHEIPRDSFRSYLLKKIVWSKSLQLLVFISEEMRRLWHEEHKNVPASFNWIVAHDGVDVEDFRNVPKQAEARENLGIPPGIFTAGYTGSLFPGRGGDLLLDLADGLRHILFFVVGGEGTFLESFKKKASSLRISNLIVTGFVPHKKIPIYLSAFDVLLMPYQKEVLHRQKYHDTSIYMSPLKMFEYMASGRPLVASRLPVLEEVLSHGDNALLVEPSNREEWRSALLKLERHKNLSRALGKKAAEDILAYSWKRRAERILKAAGWN